MTSYGPVGTLVKNDGTNVITFVRTYDVAPERLWHALTTPEGVTSWLAPAATIDARPGGTIEMTFDEENQVTGVITTWEPITAFGHTWVINNEVPSDVRYELTPTAGGTELRLVHSGLPDEMCGGYTPGWHAYLARLESAASGVQPPDWMDVFGEVAAQYA